MKATTNTTESSIAAKRIALVMHVLTTNDDQELDALLTRLANGAPMAISVPVMPVPGQSHMPEPFQVKIVEAARRLSISYRHMCRMIERGEIPAVGQGRMRRVALSDISVWQARNRTREGGK